MALVVVDFDRLPGDVLAAVSRQALEFHNLLCRKYDVIAYAHATRLLKLGEPYPCLHQCSATTRVIPRPKSSKNPAHASLGASRPVRECVTSPIRRTRRRGRWHRRLRVRFFPQCCGQNPAQACKLKHSLSASTCWNSSLQQSRLASSLTPPLASHPQSHARTANRKTRRSHQ